jgi:hypothetical protein
MRWKMKVVVFVVVVYEVDKCGKKQTENSKAKGAKN